ncbi:MAG: DNA polymerase III subunit beta [bacterium]|nr:DNA polymerase III subunit beta [bacterium]
MKVICTKKNLGIGLQQCSRIIGGGGALPILNNILLKTDNGRLKISSTNLEIAVNTWVGGKVEEEGEITVPAILINDYVGNLLSEKVTLTTKNQTLLLEGEKAQTHIKGLSAEDFPLIPKIGDESYTKIEGANLQAAISGVAFASAYSETQPEISGVLFTLEEKTLTIAATDRYRLAEARIELEDTVPAPRQVIIPHRAVAEIGRMAGGGVVEVFLTEGQICMKTDSSELISRLIEGQYPDYKQIIPKGFGTEAVLGRGDFMQSLKAASLFAIDNNNIELEINPQTKKVLIKSQSAQVGDSEIEVEAEITGAKNSIMFNYRYLLDCLNNLPDEKIKLMVINSASPAQIMPQGRDNYLYIVMPIKI